MVAAANIAKTKAAAAEAAADDTATTASTEANQATSLLRTCRFQMQALNNRMSALDGVVLDVSKLLDIKLGAGVHALDDDDTGAESGEDEDKDSQGEDDAASNDRDKKSDDEAAENARTDTKVGLVYWPNTFGLSAKFNLQQPLLSYVQFFVVGFLPFVYPAAPYGIKFIKAGFTLYACKCKCRID